jgi:hypothetical protein
MAFQFEIKRSVSPYPSPIYLELYILRDLSDSSNEHENVESSIRKNSKFDLSTKHSERIQQNQKPKQWRPQ